MIAQDLHKRTFSYLRLSLTDACNFRCQYCLPQGYSKQSSTGNFLEDTPLSLFEIQNLVEGFSKIGFKKVRLTGGEPTLRTDIIDIVQSISEIEGIESIGITTNGYRLDSLVEPLKKAGLNALNVSLDSLCSENFQKITGSKLFERIYEGILQALSAGIKRVKINVVLLKSYIDKDFETFLNFARETDISIRFIELMRTGDNQGFFSQEYYSGEAFRSLLIAHGWNEHPRAALDGPAQEYSHSSYKGRLGIIAPYSPEFCSSCNRLRVSSRGKLKLCLFGNGEISLRHLLQSPSQSTELQETIISLLYKKPPSHQLHEGLFGNTHTLSSIGG